MFLQRVFSLFMGFHLVNLINTMDQVSCCFLNTKNTRQSMNRAMITYYFPPMSVYMHSFEKFILLFNTYLHLIDSLQVKNKQSWKKN